MTPNRRRWITAAFFFLSGILTASWSLRIPDVQDKLGLNNAAWGVVLAALPIGMLFGLAFAGWLVTRFGTKKIIISTCVIVALLLGLVGLAEVRVQLMILLFFTGFFRTVLNIAMNANAIEVQHHFERPIISSFHGIWSAACLITSGINFLMGMLFVPLRTHFMIIAAICILIAVVLNSQDKVAVTITAEKKPFFIKPDRYLWLLGSIAFCGMIAENTMFDWSVNYFETAVAAGKERSTVGFTSFIITMTLGRLVGDRFIHRYGHLKMLMINGILMTAGFALAAGVPHLLPAAFGFLLIGLGDSTIVPIVYALAARSSQMQAAYAITAVTLIGYAGFLLAPLLVGGISELLGMQWAFALVAILSLCISVLSIAVKKRVYEETQKKP